MKINCYDKFGILVAVFHGDCYQTINIRREQPFAVGGLFGPVLTEPYYQQAFQVRSFGGYVVALEDWSIGDRTNTYH